MNNILELAQDNQVIINLFKWVENDFSFEETLKRIE